MKTWFTIKAKAGTPKAAEIAIFDEIGFWGVTAASFVRDLKALGDVETIDLMINSPGGSVFDGLAIYNALRQHPATVNVKVMGVAASAASFIAMAGDKITMPENTFLMVHNPMGGVFGNADEMREWADTLDKIAASLVGIYVKRTGKSEDEVKALLDAETWLTAKEALDLGFADEVVADMKIAASFDMSLVPENVRAAWAPQASTDPEPEDEDEEHPGETFADQVNALAKAADLEVYASVFALGTQTLDDAKARISTAREIRALCAVAKQDAAADAFIRAAKSIDDVRASLINSMASADEKTHTDNARRNPSSPAPTQPSAVKVSDIWAKRRNQSK